MSVLTVIIDRKKKTAVFFGPGTFEAKEQIKELGKARWLGDEKRWMVSNFTHTDDQLLAVFPFASIEAEDSSSEDSSSAPPLKKSSSKSKIKDTPKESAGQDPELPSGYSVPELVQEARAVINSAFSGVTYVYGVVQKVKPYSGRVYLDLSEDSSSKESISCVIWGDSDDVLKPLIDKGFKLEPELEVMFAVKVELSPSRANLSLNIRGVVPEYTIAKVQALREKTNQRLKKEGLFEKNKQKELPLLPQKLGILTSQGGTVINDFKAALDASEFAFELYWYPVSVQGAAAKKQIVKGIKQLSKRKELDAILLFRGGGSVSDLMVFNEYEVAKAISNCRLPVFSAIGHQEDQSSSQDVSFRAFGVPKDLGHFFASIIEDLRSRFIDSVSNIEGLSSDIIESSQNELVTLSTAIKSSGLLLVSQKKERSRYFSSSVLSMGGELCKRNRHAYISLKAPLMALVQQKLLNSKKIFKSFSLNIQSSALQKNKLLLEKLINKKAFLAQQILSKTNDKKLRVKAFEDSFLQLDPKIQLRRGFALIKKVDTKDYITKGNVLKKGEEFEIEFQDTSRKGVVKD